MDASDVCFRRGRSHPGGYSSRIAVPCTRSSQFLHSESYERPAEEIPCGYRVRSVRLWPHCNGASKSAIRFAGTARPANKMIEGVAGSIKDFHWEKGGSEA